MTPTLLLAFTLITGTRTGISKIAKEWIESFHLADWPAHLPGF